jgi:hypothetical protein
MKPTSSIAKGCPRSLTRRAALAAIGFAAAVIASSQLVFAQVDDGFGSRSIEHQGIPMTSEPYEPWYVTPPSLADPALAPAPKEPMEPPLTQMHPPFMSRPNGRFNEPWNDRAMPFIQPMAVSPSSPMGMPRGGLPYPLR